MILCALVITQIGEEEDCELGGGRWWEGGLIEERGGCLKREGVIEEWRVDD
jgi:hypothetical protein